MNFLNWNLALASKLTLQFASFSIVAALAALAPSSIQTYAQQGGEEIPGVGPITASESETIREAPFSQVFPVSDAFGIKDQDYNPAETGMGVFSLWGDIPTENRLILAIIYCVPNLDLTRQGASLREVTLLRRENELVQIDQKLHASITRREQLSAGRHTNAFFDPYMARAFNTNPNYGFYHHGSSYVPPVQCSSGSATFDLMPVREAIAQLPNRTLNLRLTFSNGSVENWHLGRGTVEALKQLPTIGEVR